MKALIALALLASLPTLAHADFSLKGELTCLTEDGKKFLINDALAGGPGSAIHSDSPRKTLRVTTMVREGSARLVLDPGVRAFAPDFVLVLDLNGIQNTTRQEGAELAHYSFVPAKVELGSLTGRKNATNAKCFQPN